MRCLAVALAAGALVLTPVRTATAQASARTGDTLTLSVTDRDEATATLSGMLRDKAHHRPMAGKVVQILWEATGSTRWQPLGKVRTNARGRYATSFTLRAAGTFRARFAGDLRFSGSQSPTHAAAYVPPDGTSVWANDCHYYVMTRNWYADDCEAQLPGNVIALYRYVPSGDHFGPLFFQFWTGDPTHVTFRDETDALFDTAEWARFPVGGTPDASNFQVLLDVDGTSGWYSDADIQQLVADQQAGATVVVSPWRQPAAGAAAPSAGDISSQADNINDSTLQIGSVAARIGAIGSSAEGDTGPDTVDGCLSVASGCTGLLLGSATAPLQY